MIANWLVGKYRLRAFSQTKNEEMKSNSGGERKQYMKGIGSDRKLNAAVVRAAFTPTPYFWWVTYL